MVDDNRSATFFEPLADLTNNLLNADLVQVHTFDEMKSIFDESPYEYQAIILDGKGQKSAGSKMEDGSFLNTSLKWLRQKTQEGFYIPYVIYSGYAEELKAFYDDEPIYWKGKSEEQQMLTALNDKIKESEYFKQCNLFPELYELFGFDLIPAKYKPDLVKATQLSSESFFGNLEDVLRSLRLILEASLYRLDEMDKTLLSTACFYREKVNVHESLYHLAGRPTSAGDEIIFDSRVILPLHVYYLVDNIRKITNSAAMHHYDESSSRFLVKSTVYALFEYLMWFKNFYLKNYHK
jgi:hypothetical protein